MRWRSLVVGWVVVVVVAGCASEEPEPAPEKPSPEKPVPTTSSDVPVDRDLGAVLAALRRTDLCAAIDAGVDERLSADGPFSCRVETAPASVRIATRVSSPEGRRSMDLRTIGGAKGYVTRDPDDDCEVELPVSFELVIRISAFGPPSGRALCEPGLRVATVLASALADPVPVEATWDACGAVWSAFDIDEREVPVALDYCDVPGGLDHLVLKYEAPPEGAERDTVGDTGVWVSEGEFAGERSCFVAWSLGASRSRYAPAGAEYLASVDADECTRAEEVAGRLIPVLAGSPPDDVTPQRPLLYGPDEADMPGG